MNQKELMGRAGKSVFFGFVVGAIIFITMYNGEKFTASSAVKKFFEHTLSPEVFSMSMALTCLVALARIQLRISKIDFSHWATDFIENVIYFKFFSALSIILGFSVALNIQHKIELGYFNEDMKKISIFMFSMLLISLIAFYLLIDDYIKNSKKFRTVEAARYMLSLFGWVFFLVGVYYA